MADKDRKAMKTGPLLRWYRLFRLRRACRKFNMRERPAKVEKLVKPDPSICLLQDGHGNTPLHIILICNISYSEEDGHLGELRDYMATCAHMESDASVASAPSFEHYYTSRPWEEHEFASAAKLVYYCPDSVFVENKDGKSPLDLVEQYIRERKEELEAFKASIAFPPNPRQRQADEMRQLMEEKWQEIQNNRQQAASDE